MFPKNCSNYDSVLHFFQHPDAWASLQNKSSIQHFDVNSDGNTKIWRKNLHIYPQVCMHREIPFPTIRQIKIRASLKNSLKHPWLYLFHRFMVRRCCLIANAQWFIPRVLLRVASTTQGPSSIMKQHAHFKCLEKFASTTAKIKEISF